MTALAEPYPPADTPLVASLSELKVPKVILEASTFAKGIVLPPVVKVISPLSYLISASPI